MPSFKGEFLTLSQIKQELDAARAAAHAAQLPFKFALTISGGGARGAYEAGAAEALLGSGLVPDLIVGTSAGALVGFGLFIDLLFPTQGTAPFSGTQTGLWKDLGLQNNGAFKVVSEPWLIDLISFKTVGLILEDISASLDAGLHALTLLQNEVQVLLSALNTDLNTVDDNAIQTFTDAVTKLNALRVSVLSLNAKNIKDAITLAKTISGEVVNKGIADVNTLVETTKKALQELRNDIQATGQLSGNLLNQFQALDSILRGELVSLRVLLDFIALVAMTPPASSPHPVQLKNSFTTLEPLKRTLTTFATGLRTGPMVSGPTPPRSIVAAWRNGAQTDLIITTTDLNEQRLILFGLAKPENVNPLLNAQTWYVDLSHGQGQGQHRTPILSDQLFTPDPTPGVIEMNAQVIDAVVTSASVPVFFEPQTWNLNRTITVSGSGRTAQRTAQSLMGRQLVDGGVADNSPIDIAIGAGATHIISLELDPLLSDIPSTGGPVAAPVPPNLFCIAWETVNAGMAASQANSIQRLIQINSTRLDTDPNKIQLYRLAPKQFPKKSIQSYQFDGNWDPLMPGQLVMGLYDWCMQGYIDAKGLTGSSVTADPVIIDYLRPSNNGFKLNATDLRNSFWRASTVATPTITP